MILLNEEWTLSLENNPSTHRKDPGVFATTKTLSMQDWHQIFRHDSWDIFENLERFTEGVIVVDKRRSPRPRATHSSRLLLIF